MRDRATRNGISIQAYAGTTGVLLALNVTPAKRAGLLGFAIEREGPGRRHRWLRGLLRFPGEARALTPIDSKLAPIQKFRWSDYSVYPATRYRYRVHGVYGRPASLKYKPGGEVAVTTEALDTGTHQVIFNRAAAASQAYSRRFGAANPDDPQHQAARDWLSRGLREKLLAFVQRARSDRWALDVAIYEIELPEVVDLLAQALQRGARVRLVYHGKPNDDQTHVNEGYLRSLPAAVKRARVTSAIFHQKFIVLSRLDATGAERPVAVLTGSTNFTANGVYRQANVIHVVEDSELAAEYLRLFERLFAGADRGQTKRYINANDPISAGPVQAVFSPRSNLTELQEVCAILDGTRHDVVFCTAFNLHETVAAALAPPQPDGVIRYGLQNSRTTITGTHRFGTYVTAAYLREGLEGFLRESTVGQRGNILIHLKAIVSDFTTRSPVVISGSNNFSTSASSRNDENMLILRGATAVADTYVCEMLRLYDHYRFRFNVRSRKGRGPAQRLTLAPDDSWTDRYFQPGSLLEQERIRFNRPR